MRFLNISGNYCHRGISQIPLPRKLMSIKADDVDWKGFTFASFLAVIFDQFPRGFRLSVARAKMAAKHWPAILLQLLLFDVRLGSLTWDGNSVGEPFYRFLEQMKGSLEVLSVSDCNVDASALAGFLRGSAVKELYVAGSMTRSLGAGMLTVLRAAPATAVVDVSDSQAGDEVIDGLCEYLRSARNTALVIDGMSPRSAEYMRVIDAAIDCEGWVSFPVRDLQYLVDSGVVGVAEANVARARAAIPEAPATEIGALLHEVEHSPLKVPTRLYMYHRAEFPDRAALEALAGAPNLPMPQRPLVKRAADITAHDRSASMTTGQWRSLMAREIGAAHSSANQIGRQRSLQAMPVPGREAAATVWRFPALLSDGADGAVLARVDALYDVDRMALALTML